MADSVQGFTKAPSHELLNKFCKDKLLEVAAHYDIEIPDKRVKEASIRTIVIAGLIDQHVFSVHTDPPKSEKPGLTFEQQKELKDKELELARMTNELELARIQLQQEKLQLVREGKLSGESTLESDSLLDRPSGPRARAFDPVHNLKMLPPFNEDEPETFFELFERVADGRQWPERDRCDMLQSVFKGKAQEAYSSLTREDSRRYDRVKEAVLQAYELIPEAYRHRFRTLRKTEKQTWAQHGRDLTRAFNRWCSSEEITTFDAVCELMRLEQFKNNMPEYLARYIDERMANTVSAAAVLADGYVLTHASRAMNRRSEQEAPRPRKNNWARGDSIKSGPKNEQVTQDKSTVCHYCQESGHWKNECPRLKAKKSLPKGKLPSVKPCNFVGPVVSMPVNTLPSDNGKRDIPIDPDYAEYVTEGFVSLMGSNTKVPVKILRDTGSAGSFISESVLPFSAATGTGECMLVRDFGLNIHSVPVHRVVLSSDLCTGEVEMGVRSAMALKGVDVILGNILAKGRESNVSPPPLVSNIPFVAQEQAPDIPKVYPACVVTRSMSKVGAEGAHSDEKPSGGSLARRLPTLPPSVSREDIIKEQASDSTLQELFKQVVSEEESKSLPHSYTLHDSLLVRSWIPYKGEGLGEPAYQVVIPVKYREMVLKTSHDNIAGHLGVKKTHSRIFRHFYWPNLKRDVSAFIRTCHTCQLTGKSNQTLKPVPLCPIPAVSQPFDYLIIDCVGPLPRSKSGCTYLLTIMCQTTRFPAAYPLRSITAKSVLKALVQFMSWVGVPRVVQSDQGSNFTSRLFAQVLQQLRIQHHLASAYHPQSQGALERFHQTLKSLLRSYCTEMGGDWEEGLPWMMLAAKEVTQESTGFSPNELVFAHRVRGPLTMLQEDWDRSPPPKSLDTYVHDFRRRLYAAGEMAKKNLASSQKEMKRQFDRGAESRCFSPGDQVLALLPMVDTPFQAKFQGPFTVVRQSGECDFIIATPNRRKSTQRCHVNLLKPYYARATDDMSTDSKQALKPVLTVSSLGVSGIPPGSVVAEQDQEEAPDPDDTVLLARLRNSETLAKLDDMLSYLPSERRKEMETLIHDFPSLFSDTPSQTDLIEHDIDVGDAAPIRQRFYRVPFDKRTALEKEVQYMLENGIAEASSSSWASPCILVNKPDGTFRFCTDYRKVNSVTKPDSFPLPRMEDCVDQVGAARFVSKFDLLKGYWQVPLSPRAREISAFITPTGLFSYSVMSFGLRNAPATFQRLMNRVVAGLVGCAVYLDDVVVYSDTWEEHVERIRALFGRLAWAKLTVNLAKCEFAKATVTYLGKEVGQGEVRPVRAKVVAIDCFPAPVTKKELMRFLGMVGYYRAFCKNFSTVVAPLTDLLKGKAEFIWSPACQRAFEDAKLLLSSAPVLAAPKLTSPFVLQVDASHVGAGAALLQADDNGVERPVSFYSKKFNRHQLNYSVIEKEALALVWALKHFEVYIGSGASLIVYSDHNPLTFFRSMLCPNQRIMRWCLFLQGFHLDVRHIKGRDNVLADALSRAPV